MTWEIAIVVGILGIAFILLYLSSRIDREVNSMFPIQLIFVTLSMLFGISGLRLSSLIVDANEAVINNAAVSANLISILDNAYITMSWIFYIFIIITALSFLISLINGLRKMKWR